MKKAFLSAVLFFILALALTLPARAGEVEVAPDGSLRVTDVKEWRGTKVTVGDDVLAYGEKWKEAYRNPGKMVPVVTRRAYAVSGWFEETVTTSADVAVRYDKDARAVRLVANAGVVDTKTRFNSFLIFAVVSLFMMLVSNILLARKQPSAVAAIAAIAVAAAAAIAAATIAAIAAIAAVATIAAATIAAIAAIAAVAFFFDVKDMASLRWYVFFSFVFYVCMVLSAYLMFN